MRKKLTTLIAIILIFIGFFLFFQILGYLLPRGKGALQVTSSVKAKVLLNGKLIGTTPLCKCDAEETIEEGTYSLQLVPEDSSPTYTTKVKIGKGVLTAVDRTFLPGSFGSAYTLLLEKLSSASPQLFISSIPDGALVSIDGNDSGVTPLLVKDISASEHEIELQKGGYGKKTIRIKTVPNYKLIVEATLGTKATENETIPGTETSPTPTPTPQDQVTVTILSTPTGFLRVRSEANLSSTEIGRVNPGDALPLLSEEAGWFEIKLPDGKTGFISSDFAQKSTP